MNRDLKRMSKFLSYVLRHNPGELDLELQEGGWVEVDVFLAGASARESTWTMEKLREIVTTDEKGRYAFSDDGLAIRANQGHSVEVDLQLVAIEPPDILYHGTASRFEASIRESGLVAMNRHHVHLSLERTTAIDVGTRHGKPIVFEIDAKSMHAKGFEFFVSANGVWLAERIPPEFFL